MFVFTIKLFNVVSCKGLYNGLHPKSSWSVLLHHMFVKILTVQLDLASKDVLKIISPWPAHHCSVVSWVLLQTINFIKCFLKLSTLPLTSQSWQFTTLLGSTIAFFQKKNSCGWVGTGYVVFHENTKISPDIFKSCHLPNFLTSRALTYFSFIGTTPQQQWKKWLFEGYC